MPVAAPIAAPPPAPIRPPVTARVDGRSPQPARAIVRLASTTPTVSFLPISMSFPSGPRSARPTIRGGQTRQWAKVFPATPANGSGHHCVRGPPHLGAQGAGSPLWAPLFIREYGG